MTPNRFGPIWFTIALVMAFPVAAAGALGAASDSEPRRLQTVPTATMLPTGTPTAQSPIQESGTQPLPASGIPATIPFERGFDPNNLTASYYDGFDLTGFVLSEPWTGPIDFLRTCFGEPFPYEGCKLHAALEEGGNYSASWEGALIIPVDGDYTFRFSSVDNEARLFMELGGILTNVLSSGGASPNPAPPVTVPLAGPSIAIRVEFKQFSPGAASLTLHWHGPGFVEEIIPIYTQYTCPNPSAVLSDIGQAVYAVVQPQNFCGNQFEDLVILPPGKDAFERFAILASNARFAVDFTTMVWAEDTNDPSINSPAEYFLQGIAQLYSKMLASPFEYPQGMNVRLLLGLEHRGFLGTAEDDQRQFVLQELRDLDIPLFDDSIGWKVQVASFRKSNPDPTVNCAIFFDCPSETFHSNHSHAKLLIVDGNTALSGGYNFEHIYLTPSESPEGADEPMHDIGMQVSGPIAADAHAAYAELWREARGLCEPVGPGIVFVPIDLQSCAGYTVEPVAPLAFSGTGSDFVFSLLRDGDPDQDGLLQDIEADEAILASIRTADSEINMLVGHLVVLPWPITDMPYADALIDTILQNDTNVRILLSAKPLVLPLNAASGWSLFTRLVNESTPGSLDRIDNLDLRFFSQAGEGGLHSKAFSADGQLTVVGSHDLTLANWHEPFGLVDVLQLDIAEHSLAIDSSVATAAYDQYFNEQWDIAGPIIRVNPNIRETLDEAAFDSFVFVPPGIYTGAAVDLPVTIVGAGPDDTVIDCQGEDTGFLVTSPRVTISNLRIRNCDIGIEIAGTGEESPESVAIRNVLFENPGSAGVRVQGQSEDVSFVIENNTFFGGFVGIELSISNPQGEPSRIRNNIFSGQVEFPISILAGDGDLVEYSYNLFHNCGLGNCAIEWLFGSIGSGSTVHNNLFDADPLFVDPFGGTFRLDSDSPARDASDPAILETIGGGEAYYIVFDSDGNGVPAFDIGAFESEMADSNRKPVAYAGAGYVADEGSPIAFDGSFSAELDGEALEYIWSFDGDAIWDTESSSEPTAQFTFTDNFDGFVVLEVSDPNGLTDTDAAFVTVFNVDPIAEAGTDIVATVGESIQFQGSFSDPGLDDTHLIEWDFDDSGTASGSLTPTHAYTSPGAYIVTLTVMDDDDGVGQDTLTVVVTEQGFGLNGFVLLGEEGVWVEQGATVVSGDVGANVASVGPHLAEGSEVTIGISAMMQDPDSRVLGDSLFLKDNAQVYDVYYNELNGLGDVLGQEVTPLDLPLVLSFPDLPAFNPGSQEFDVPQGGTQVIQAGSYGLLRAPQNSTITFTGGSYDFSDWDVGIAVTLEFEAPSEVRIAGRLAVDQDITLGPATGASGMDATDIVIYVNGINGSSGTLGATPKAAKFGIGTVVSANVFAPNGTLWLRQGGQFTGAFLAKWVILGKDAVVVHQSGW